MGRPFITWRKYVTRQITNNGRSCFQPKLFMIMKFKTARRHAFAATHTHTEHRAPDSCCTTRAAVSVLYCAVCCLYNFAGKEIDRGKSECCHNPWAFRLTKHCATMHRSQMMSSVPHHAPHRTRVPY